MAKNPRLTELDPNQLSRITFDSDHDAQRVILVGGEGLTINADVKMPHLVDKQLEIKEIHIPTIIKEIEIKEIQTQVIVKEPQIIEIEKIVIQDRIVYVDKPVIITEIKEIQVPLVQKEFAKIPMWVYVCFGIQTLALMVSMLKTIIK